MSNESPGTCRPLANKDNDYLIDRAGQKAGRTFSGVEGFGMQDASIQESMGPIVDRAKENLVLTDNGIIMARHRLLRSIKALVDKGESTAGRRSGPPAGALGRRGVAARPGFQRCREGSLDGACGYCAGVGVRSLSSPSPRSSRGEGRGEGPRRVPLTRIARRGASGLSPQAGRGEAAEGEQAMLSESAKMSSAAEAGFGSTSRTPGRSTSMRSRSTAPSEKVVKHLAQAPTGTMRASSPPRRLRARGQNRPGAAAAPCRAGWAISPDVPRT